MTGGINLLTVEPLAKFFGKVANLDLDFKEPIKSFIG